MEWQIAANTFIWHSPLRDESLRELLPKLRAWGFDAVELALENVGDWDPSLARDLLHANGLSSVVGAVFGPGRDLVAAPERDIEAGMAYMRSAIDIASAQGSRMVIGPMYTSVGRTWRISPDERAEIEASLVHTYRELGSYAAERNVQIAVEPLNRYETSLFNTTEQVLRVITAADHPCVGVNLDTYHMNIEERSFADPIRAAGRKLFHLQVCGNDRGAPGRDLTNWSEIFEALREIDYDGLLGIESFTSDNDTIAVAASIWRPLAETQDRLAIDGLAFLRRMRDRYTAQST